MISYKGKYLFSHDCLFFSISALRYLFYFKTNLVLITNLQSEEYVTLFVFINFQSKFPSLVELGLRTQFCNLNTALKLYIRPTLLGYEQKPVNVYHRVKM